MAKLTLLLFVLLVVSPTPRGSPISSQPQAASLQQCRESCLRTPHFQPECRSLSATGASATVGPLGLRLEARDQVYFNRGPHHNLRIIRIDPQVLNASRNKGIR